MDESESGDTDAAAFAKELKCLEKRAEKCADKHRCYRKWYGRAHWLIGFPAAALAAAAGTTALTEKSPGLTAGIAFASAALTALLGLTRPDEREQSHRERMAAYSAVAADARITHLFRARTFSEESVPQLEKLYDRFHALEGQATFPE
jgi:hypothetical protein